MINIAIVEDDDIAAQNLENNLIKYQEMNNVNFNIQRFTNARTFLSNCNKIFDIVFMDIQLPGMNGLVAAAELRKFDTEMILFFVTNMTQYAVKGYEVDALDFIIKPVVYENFCLKIKKALDIISANQEVDMIIANKSGLVRLSSKDIIYVEVVGHKLIYYTASDSYQCSGSLTEVGEKLKKFSFMRCNNCYLINPRYILSVNGHTVMMSNNKELLISHPKKKEFMKELADWLGQGNK